MSDTGSDSDAEELAPFPPGEEVSSDDDEPPAPPPVEAKTKKLYILHGKTYYEIEHVDPDDPSLVGITRCYMDRKRVVVESGERMGSLVANTSGAWPKGEALCGRSASMLQYFQIVIVRGKLNKDDEVLSNSWYILFEVDDMDSDDKFILRHIPKSVYKEIQKTISKDSSMNNSTLNSMKADKDNEKPLSPSCNPEFVKVDSACFPRTLCLLPERKSKDKEKEKVKDKDKDAAEAPKKSVASLWQKPGVSEPEKPAEKPAEKRKAEEDGDAQETKTLVKRKRVSLIEEHDLIICDPSARVSLEPPVGATKGRVVITWAFD